MNAVHRKQDGELVGWISATRRGWEALSLFRCPLASFAEEDEAEAWLLDHGLGVLAGTWKVYVPEEGRWFDALIEEAAADWVRVRVHDQRAELDRALIYLDRENLGKLQAPIMGP